MKSHLFVSASHSPVVVQQRIKDSSMWPQLFQMERLSGGGSRKLAAGYLEKSRPAPTRWWAHSRFTPRECSGLASKLFMFNAPIKIGLNCRRKCTGINPYEMTLDYAVATKEQVQQQKKKNEPILEAFVVRRSVGDHLGGPARAWGGLIVGGFVVQLQKSHLLVLLRCK